MAVFNNYGAGLGNASSYQVSGKPFLSGNLNANRIGELPIQVTFPSVTRWIQVTNRSANLTLSCSLSPDGLGENNNLFVLQTGEKAGCQSPVYELKVTDLYFTGSENFDVVAGLTGIDPLYIKNNWTGSAGIG